MERCIIYGSGRWGIFAYEEYRSKMNILGFADADPQKQGGRLFGLPIFPPQMLPQHTDILTLIAVKYGATEIIENLRVIGVYNTKRYIPGMSAWPRNKPDAWTRAEPGILVDLSNLACEDSGTGIPRVVRNVFSHLAHTERSAIPVQDIDGSLSVNMKYIGDCPQWGSMLAARPIAFHKGDKLLLLDSSWLFFRDFERFLENAAIRQATTYAVLYDLIYAYEPRLFSSSMVTEFLGWTRMIMQKADNIICISRNVADIAEQYFYENKPCRNTSLPLYVLPLGADVSRKDQCFSNVRQEIKDFVGRKKTFLMVGTIEPRKGHLTVIEAIQEISASHDIQLMIVGHDGWKNDEFKRFMRDTRMNCIRWIDDATDEEICWCYQHAAALIAASSHEGFGLPLVEAAQFGLPIICSDIPVFHEVTQEHATFFPVGEPSILADVLDSWLQEGEHPDSGKIKIYTWKESSDVMLDILYGRAVPYKVLR